MPRPRPTLIVMVKEPRPGRVKTRLGRDLGMTRAAWWYRQQCRQLLRRLRDPRWQLCLAVAPAPQALQSRVWSADLPRVPQGRGDLGARMAQQFRNAPKGPVCLIGSDIPGIGKAQIAHAFERLRGQDAIFGPAHDGGYWLIGWAGGRAVPLGFLENVRWSGPHALSDSVQTLGDARIAYAERLQDVDTLADLRQLGTL